MRSRKLNNRCTLRLLMLFGVIAVILFSVAVCIAQKDLSSDDGVAAALKLSRNRICVSRPAKLPNIIIAGDLVLDRGCRSRWVFVNGKLSDADSTEIGLLSLGWSNADRKEKERLALLWVEQVFLAFQTPITAEQVAKANKDLPKQLIPPAAQTSADGTIEVKLWNREPPGMTPQNRYIFWEYEIGKDGAFIEKKFLDQFSVPLKPLQAPPPTPSPMPAEDVQRYLDWMNQRGKPIADKPHEDVSMRIGDWGFFYHGDRSPGSFTPLLDRVALDRSGHAVTQEESSDWYALLSTHGLDAAGALKRVAWLFNAGGVDPASEPKSTRAKVSAPTLTTKDEAITFQGWWDAYTDPPYRMRITIVATRDGTKLALKSPKTL